MNVPMSNTSTVPERWAIDEGEAVVEAVAPAVRGAVAGAPAGAVSGESTGSARVPVPVRGAVSLIVPARNEAANIGWVLNRIPDCVDEVILVDGESTDATLEMARATLPSLRIVPQQGRGKGSALRTGFLAAKGEYIVMIDADGSMSPQEIPRYLHFLESGFDLVKGSRFTGGGGSLDITLMNVMYQSSLTDLCYGFVAFNRNVLDRLDLQSSGFEIETEITVRALLAGLRVAEVPTLELPRRTGQSNLRTFRDGHRVLRTLLRERNGRTAGAGR
jgi:glycosyltransferase involved in cell wall biosynthesis